MVSRSRPWLDAWVDAAYGTQGFWRTQRPAEHFRTGSSTTPLLAGAVTELLTAHPQLVGVVELGAGDGDLLAALAALRPDLALAGIDLRPAPPGLPDGATWAVDLWDVMAGGWRWGAAEQLLSTLSGPVLLIAAEWFDDLPCHIGTRADDGLHLVHVDDAGEESRGSAVDRNGRAWADRWWPTGERVEIGTTREVAWAAALTHLRRHGGLALAIDYAHEAGVRPGSGSLAAYRSGRRVAPRPSPTVNLTAAVAMDALAASGHAVGARTLLHQRQVDLIPLPTTTGHDDPLAELVARSQTSALRNRAVWGDQHWLLQAVPAR